MAQNVKDTKEAAKLRSIPVNRVVYDEYDLMDETVPGKASQRMAHSEIFGKKYGEEVYCSNPTYSCARTGPATLDARNAVRNWA